MVHTYIHTYIHNVVHIVVCRLNFSIVIEMKLHDYKKEIFSHSEPKGNVIGNSIFLYRIEYAWTYVYYNSLKLQESCHVFRHHAWHVKFSSNAGQKIWGNISFLSFFQSVNNHTVNLLYVRSILYIWIDKLTAMGSTKEPPMVLEGWYHIQTGTEFESMTPQIQSTNERCPFHVNVLWYSMEQKMFPYCNSNRVMILAY